LAARLQLFSWSKGITKTKPKKMEKKLRNKKRAHRELLWCKTKHLDRDVSHLSRRVSVTRGEVHGSRTCACGDAA
jgi:hypothetical protein